VRYCQISHTNWHFWLPKIAIWAWICDLSSVVILLIYSFCKYASHLITTKILTKHFQFWLFQRSCIRIWLWPKNQPSITNIYTTRWFPGNNIIGAEKNTPDRIFLITELLLTSRYTHQDLSAKKNHNSKFALYTLYFEKLVLHHVQISTFHKCKNTLSASNATTSTAN